MALNKRDALKIAKKLLAIKVPKRSAHDLYEVYEGDVLITQFGVSRTSRPDAGHGHIASLIHVGPHDAKLLASCPMTRAAWIERLREKGLVP